MTRSPVTATTARYVVDAEGEWIKAEDMPAACEGMFAWKWHPNMLQPEFGYVPIGYSRDPAHCASQHFMLVVVPLPPALPDRRQP